VGYSERHTTGKHGLLFAFGPSIAIKGTMMTHIETKPPVTELQRVRQWAQEKIDAGSEPPWAWYQYMKLIESIDAVFQGTECTTAMENLQQSGKHTERRLQLVEAKSEQDISQLHPVDSKVLMPM